MIVTAEVLYFGQERSPSPVLLKQTQNNENQPHINDLIMKMNLIVGQQYDRLFITL